MFKYMQERTDRALLPTDEGMAMSTTIEPQTTTVAADITPAKAIQGRFPELSDKGARHLVEIIEDLVNHVKFPPVPVPDRYGVHARVFKSTYMLAVHLGIGVADSTIQLYLQYLVDRELGDDVDFTVTVETHKEFVEICVVE